MVTSAQLRHSVGLDPVGWTDATDDVNEYDPDGPRQWSRPARITIAAVVGLALVGLALTAVGVIMQSAGDTYTVSPDTPPPFPTDRAEHHSVDEPPARTVIIHVIGQVTRPGIVELDDGARVIDALDEAGGVTAEADVEALNLARVLTDGEQVYVPAVGEEVTARPGPSHQAAAGPISVSRADQGTLQTLPGVGPALASRIIAWRETNGPFREVSDLLAVSGIGPATLERFADQVIP